MRKDGRKVRGFWMCLRRRAGRGVPTRGVTTPLFASTLLLLLACAAPPTQNQNATPAATPRQTATPAAAPAQAV